MCITEGLLRCSLASGFMDLSHRQISWSGTSVTEKFRSEKNVFKIGPKLRVLVNTAFSSKLPALSLFIKHPEEVGELD